MNPMRLFFDDEGVISRQLWWMGTLFLLGTSMAIGWGVGRMTGNTGHTEALMIFCNIAMLIPFHAVNAKRFRAIGRSPVLALWGGVVPAASVLADSFFDLPAMDILLGWMIMGIMVWYVLDLGIYPHEAHASRSRIDAAVKRA
jgi:uncharacterized membrane protein YhaH (DUF805 family)